MKSNKDNKTWISNILVRNIFLCLKQVYCCLTFVCVYICKWDTKDDRANFRVLIEVLSLSPNFRSRDRQLNLRSLTYADCRFPFFAFRARQQVKTVILIIWLEIVKKLYVSNIPSAEMF